MNNRISPRKTIQTRVIFEDEFNEGILYFISSDISTSGVFIQTKLPLKAGTRVFLKFCLYMEDKPIHVAAEVMRQMTKKRGPGRKKPITPGVGLKFLGLSHKDFKRIEAFMAGE
ncbi:MAG: PilZ domain-containing protein [bacterium]|nr:PilZ domain-containing protein [bacterium]MBU1917724.1 PilZ domain-containing protein [bacterium]